MFIYIVINEVNYPIGTFVEINEARNYKTANNNSKIIKSTLVGNIPNGSQNLKDKLKDKLKDIQVDKSGLPDECKKMFGIDL